MSSCSRCWAVEASAAHSVKAWRQLRHETAVRWLFEVTGIDAGDLDGEAASRLEDLVRLDDAGSLAGVAHLAQLARAAR